MLDAAEALGFIGASSLAHLAKILPANAGDARDVLDLWVGRFAGGGTGNLLQYSCLENPMDRGAWRATVCGVAKSWTQQ